MPRFSTWPSFQMAMIPCLALATSPPARNVGPLRWEIILGKDTHGSGLDMGATLVTRKHKYGTSDMFTRHFFEDVRQGSAADQLCWKWVKEISNWQCCFVNRPYLPNLNWGSYISSTGKLGPVIRTSYRQASALSWIKPVTNCLLLTKLTNINIGDWTSRLPVCQY